MTAATWGCCPALRRPWRAADPRRRVPRCTRTAPRPNGAACGGAPELDRLDEVRPAVYRVAWSLSSAPSGRLRRRPPVLGRHGRAEPRTEQSAELWPPSEGSVSLAPP